MQVSATPAASLPHLHCRRAQVGPISADAAASWWRGVTRVELRENVDGLLPTQGTRVRAIWDDVFWCVLLEMDDANPWATLMERDAPLWTEETVEVFVDPVGDLEGYFELEINPLGTVIDLVLRRTVSGWRKNFAWSISGLVSLARRTPTGWAAELRIPFATIADGPPSPGALWRANFLRIDRPGGPGSEAVLSAWSPTRVRNFHRPKFFGTVEFTV